tara:strand:+ start:1416 stop:1610 length:195 start_codon:yes stop_codon:yes gene_type:complete
MNISEFERNKPRKTMSYINKLIKKYKKVWEKMDIMDDYDAAKVEMAHDFETELQELKKIFKSGK